MAGTRTKQGELTGKTVDELRRMARERGISGASSMRKEELVKAVAGGARAKQGNQAKPAAAEKGAAGKGANAGVRHGKADSKSLRYAQEIRSIDDQPERPGRSLVTTDHDVIIRWARQRDAMPATVPGTEHDRHPGVLRFDFPGFGGRQLQQISWEDWFAAFDQRGLNFIYQEQTTDGRQSNFFHLENPGREDA